MTVIMDKNFKFTSSHHNIFASLPFPKAVMAQYANTDHVKHRKPITVFRQKNISATQKQSLSYSIKAESQPIVSETPIVGRNRYLDLFTQFNIIEDSFEFVRLIFHFDPFQCVYAGNSFEKTYGYSCREIYEYTPLFYDAVHPDDADLLMQQIKTLLRNGYNEFTYRIITKGGDVKYLRTNAWCQQGENLSYVMTCYQKDVTPKVEDQNRLEKSLQKHHSISEIAIALNSVDNFEYKLQSVIDKIGNSVQVDQVCLYEIDNDLHQMRDRFIWLKDDITKPLGFARPIPPLHSLPEYICTLQYNVDSDVSGFMRYWSKPAHIQSLLLVPVRIKDKMFGFIELITIEKKRNWSDDDLSFVSSIGNMVANFYDRRSISNVLNLNYQKQELLANILYRLNKYNDDQENVLTSVLGHIGMKKPDSERIFIFKYDEKYNRFTKTHEYTKPTLNLNDGTHNEYNGDLFVEFIPHLLSGKPYCVSDVSLLKPELQSIFGRLNVKSMLIAPLFVNGRLYGVYGYNIYSHCHVWEKTEIEIAQSFAGTISHFIERQDILKKLKKSERKFKDISDNLPGYVFQATLSLSEIITLNYISPQFEQWVGIAPASRISLEKLQQALHPKDYEAFSGLKDKLRCSQPEVSFEGRFFFPDEGFKWLIVKATLSETLPSGDQVYNGLLIDMTENKQTELKLAEANISIQSIINNLEKGILLVDEKSKVLYINDKLLEMLLSVGVFDVETVHQEQILEATFNLVRDSAGLKQHTQNIMENRIEERGKELFFYQSTEFISRDYIPVFRDRQFFAHLFIFNNITHNKLQELEIKKAYKRVRTIIDYSDIGVLLLSENEKVLILNDQFLRMHHVDEPADYFINKPYRNLWNKISKASKVEGISFNQIQDAIHSGQHIINREISVNDTTTLKYFIEPIEDDRHRQSDVHERHETLIQVIDITAQKNIEFTLRNAKEEAETIAKAKSHILMSMSHEIRTPLNGILGFSEMLKSSLSDPYHRQMAEIIDQSGHRLMDTLNAILDFSIVQSDKKAYRTSSVSVNRVLHEQIKLYRTMASNKGLYIYAKIDGQIGIAIADQLLHKILQNLINNAIKYTLRGGVKIEAGITSINDTEWLDLKVVDTGVGIDEFMHKTIFEPFRQESEGYGRAFEGAGLGLSLVKEYVNKMGGKILLSSRKDEGSTFTILLPNAYFESNRNSIEIIGMTPEANEHEDYDRAINL